MITKHTTKCESMLKQLYEAFNCLFVVFFFNYFLFPKELIVSKEK